MLNIFTDKSVIRDYVRAAAVALRLNERRICYIGIEEITTVFKAELQRIVMITAITMTIKETQGQNL